MGISVLYEESRSLYREAVELLLVADCLHWRESWTRALLANADISDRISNALRLIANLYLFQSLLKVEEAVKNEPNHCIYWLQYSLLLYVLGYTKSAILSFRIAYKLKNISNLPDPFYNKSYTNKTKIYEQKALNLITQIDESILIPPDQSLTIDEIEAKLAEFENIQLETNQQKKYIDLLKNFKNENLKRNSNNSIEKLKVYQFIYGKLDALIKLEVSSFDLFYMRGDCCLHISLLQKESVDWKNIFLDYSKGLFINTSDEDTKRKLNEYKNQMVKLMNSKDKDVIRNKEDIGISAIRILEEFETESKNNKILEKKLLYLGDLYIEIKNYSEALVSYLTAAEYYSFESTKTSLSKEHTNRLKNLLKITDLEDFSKNLNEYFNSEKSVSITHQYHSYIWLKLGEKLNHSGEKLKRDKKVNISQVKKTFEYAKQAFTNALAINSDQYLIPRIYCKRAQALKGLKIWKESKKDYENALYKDIDLEGVLYQNDFRSALESLVEIEFTELINFDIPNFRVLQDIEVKYFNSWEEEFKKKIYSLKKVAGYLKRDKKKITNINNYCLRIAGLFYVKGIFFYKKKDVFFGGIAPQDSRIKCLEQSLKAYKKALNFILNEIDDWSTLKLKPTEKWFTLDIIEQLLKTSYLLGDYSNAQEYLKAGMDVIYSLLKNRNNENFNVPKLSNKLKTLEAAFDITNSFFEAPEKALLLAEKCKNAALNSLFKKNGKKMQENEFSYETIQRKLLSPDTAIIYWYLGITEIVCFLLLDNEVTPLVISQSTPEEYKTFKSYIDTWDLILNNQTNKEYLYFQENSFNECLNKLYEVLNIKTIKVELCKRSDIKKIILVPHRDLHRIPLHVFFSEFFEDDHLNCEILSLSYLPSLEIGMQLAPNLLPSTNMMIVLPFTNLTYAPAEAASIYVKYHNATGILPTRLEGSEAKNAKIGLHLKNDLKLSYFHFLGHAHHDIEQPQNSALELTEKDTLTIESIVEYLDLSNYYLVCLSACETGITTPESPLDEYVGLVSAFLSKGVSYVVSTLWKVEDIPTTIIMIQFYNRIIDGQKHPTIALAEAQRWLRNVSRQELSKWCIEQASDLQSKIDELQKFDFKEFNLNALRADVDKIEHHSVNIFLDPQDSPDDCPYKHPYYWAGFTITGLNS
ncbi:MAG: CHAT domain-containing protein [Symploca sp. SIO2D2]|nr:CHAT domain-containing protein [Symploca sp. SIO2D2]